MKNILLLSLLCLAPFAVTAKDNSREVGAVSTAFKLVGPNHKIVVSAFEDPKISGITCYVARPRTGGIKGGLGLAEDPSLASVSCTQTGPVRYLKPIEAGEKGEEVFDESRSLIFKSLEIRRLFDEATASLVYVVRTTRIIEGSPTTSLAVITPTSWEGTAPSAPLLKD